MATKSDETAQNHTNPNRPTAGEDRERLVIGIRQMVAEEPQLATPLATSLVARGEEYGSRETAPLAILERLATISFHQNPHIGCILNCLRAVKDDLHFALREQEIKEAKAEELAKNEKGEFGKVVIEWQALLGTHIFPDMDLERVFQGKPWQIERALRENGRGDRADEFNAAIKAAKAADRKSQFESTRLGQATSELADLLKPAPATKRPAPKPRRQHPVASRPANTQTAPHEQSSILDTNGKLRDAS